MSKKTLIVIAHRLTTVQHCDVVYKMEKGKIISDDEIKSELSEKIPYRERLAATQIVLEDLKGDKIGAKKFQSTELYNGQKAFGYTQEDLRLLMTPMAVTGQEAIGSMGTDTPIAAMSNKTKLLYNYFKQNFAQVTNPPIDPIREESVMSLVSFIGPRPNLFDKKNITKLKRLEVRQPILSNVDLEKIRHIDNQNGPFKSETLSICYPVSDGTAGMKFALKLLCETAQEKASTPQKPD